MRKENENEKRKRETSTKTIQTWMEEKKNLHGAFQNLLYEKIY